MTLFPWGRVPRLPDDYVPGSADDGDVPIHDEVTNRWVPGLPTSGTVKSVNGVEPDEDGNVVVSTADWNADMLAIARGFYEILSPTEPEQTTYTASNAQVYPVVWIKPIEVVVPVVPAEPSWDLVALTIEVPTLVGVEYRLVSSTKGGVDTAHDVVIPPGAPFDLTVETAQTVPFSVLVEAVALPGYFLLTPMSWANAFPDPDASTLLASDDFATDRTTLPFDLNNALGGSTTLPFKMLSPMSSGYVSQGGVLVPDGPSNNGRRGVVIPGVENVRVQFDIVSIGTNTTNSVNGAIAYVSLRARNGPPNGGGLYLGIAHQPGAGANRNISFIGANVVAGVTSADLIGTWTMQVFGGVATVTPPNAPATSLDISDILDAQTGGTDALEFRHVNNADSGTSFDNLKIWSLG